MLVPDITDPLFPPMVKGAEDALAKAGYTLALADTDNDEAKERLQLGGMLQSQVDGLLMATARRRSTTIEQLRSGPVPLVLVNRTIDRGGVSAVIPDDHGGMLLAVEHLYQLGHRRICHIAGPLDTSPGRAAPRGSATRCARSACLPGRWPGRSASTRRMAGAPRPSCWPSAPG